MKSDLTNLTESGAFLIVLRSKEAASLWFTNLAPNVGRIGNKTAYII